MNDPRFLSGANVTTSGGWGEGWNGPRRIEEDYMSDIDIDALKRLTIKPRACRNLDSHLGPCGCCEGCQNFENLTATIYDRWPAIIAALEDRERLRAVLRDIASEPEVDGRCPECVTDGYHEDWCTRGKAIVALEEKPS
jgi:hypothetical protein